MKLAPSRGRSSARQFACSSWCATAVAATMCMSAPLVARADEPAGKQLAEFTIDTSGLEREGEDIAALTRSLDKRLGAALEQRHVARNVATAPKLRLVVLWLDYKRSDYIGKYEAMRPGNGQWTDAARFECFACSNTALSKKAEELLDEALENASRPPKPAPTTHTPANPDRPATSPTTTPPVDTTPRDDGKHPLGGLGKAGIGIGVVGIAVLGTGIGLAVHGSKLDASVSDEADKGTDSGAAGIALSAAGGVALLAGITMLVVDRVRARQSRVSASIGGTPHSFGFQLQGRF